MDRGLATRESAKASKMCWHDMQLNEFFLSSEQTAWSGCSSRWAQTEWASVSQPAARLVW
eukprot:632102-Pleurochrysis_carterae.AAC.1